MMHAEARGSRGVGVSEALRLSQLTVSESAPLKAASLSGSVWATPARSAKWGLEDNTACYGQEKKLWVNTAICLPPLARLSHTIEASTPYERIKRQIYFYNHWGHSSSMYILPSWVYNKRTHQLQRHAHIQEETIINCLSTWWDWSKNLVTSKINVTFSIRFRCLMAYQPSRVI